MVVRHWLVEILEEVADAMLFVERWPQWVIYLLKHIQEKTSPERYEEFLHDLKGAIDARLEDGRW